MLAEAAAAVVVVVVVVQASTRSAAAEEDRPMGSFYPHHIPPECTAPRRTASGGPARHPSHVARCDRPPGVLS